MLIRLLLILYSLVVVSYSTAQQGDLVMYVEQVSRQTEVEKIAPLPEIKMFKTQPMSLKGLRNPFNVSMKEMPAQVADSRLYEPDLTRQKTPLEKVSLEKLKFSGVIEQAGNFWAIITDMQNQHTHIVQVGDYLGQNYGRIDKITTRYVEIDERKKGQEGQWNKVTTMLKLDQVN